MGVPRLLIADGHLGIWAAVPVVFLEIAEQRCWNHKLLNVLDPLPRRLQAEARALLREISYAPTREDAEVLRGSGRPTASLRPTAPGPPNHPQPGPPGPTIHPWGS